MKKFVAWILLVCLICCQIVVVNASTTATADKNAPKINSVSIDNMKNPYTTNDRVEMKVVASDDLALNYATYIIKNMNSSEEIHILDPKNSDDGFYNGFTINSLDYTIKTGNYQLIKVVVYDKSNNSASMDANDFGDIIFKVENETTLEGKPIIESLTVSEKSGTSAGTEFAYTMTVDTSGFDLTGATLVLESVKDDTVGLSFEQDEKNNKKYVSKFVVANSFWGSGYSREIHFREIQLYDDKGNVYFYYPEDSTNIDWYNRLPITGVNTGDLDITLTDIPVDTEAPVLINYKYEKDKLYTPDYQEISIKAKDNLEPFRVTVYWAEEGKDSLDLKSFGYFVDEYGEKSNTAVFNINFPRYIDNTVYYISEMVIEDAAGNKNTYSLSDGTLKKKTFEIINNNEADMFTSTSDEQLVSKLESIPEGSTVVINIDEQVIGTQENGMDIYSAIIPKEAFDAIKGRNVTIIFEKVYDDAYGGGSSDEGLQWIMNGKDIVKNTKDIDVYFYMEEAWSNNWIKEQEKLHSTPLPPFQGPGTSEEAEKTDMNKMFKSYLEKYGWGDIIHQLTVERKGKETLNETFDRLSYDPYVRFVFADNGELPGKATIRMKPAYSMYYWLPDQNLNLYYYNENANKFQLKQKGINKHSEGYYDFNVYHNSEYALADEDFGNVVAYITKEQSDFKNNKAPKTGDSSNLVLPALSILSVLLLAGVVVATRKKTM